MKAKTNARGYGSRHQKMRAAWAPKVAAGIVSCASCGKAIRPLEAWDLGHVPGDKSRYIGPQHAACNRNTVAERRRAPTPEPAWRRPDGIAASEPWGEEFISAREWASGVREGGTDATEALEKLTWSPEEFGEWVESMQ